MKSLHLASLVLGLALFTTEVVSCAVTGQACFQGAPDMCECDSGWIMACGQVSPGQWIYLKSMNCPVPPNGGLQCVNGECTS